MVTGAWFVLQEAPEAPSTPEEIDVGLDLVVTVLLVVAAAYLVARAVDWLLTNLADQLLANRFRLTLLIPIAKLLVYGTALYLVVGVTIEPSPEQLVTFAGLFGAALGFGLRDLVADIMGGLVIVLERPYRIGDKVSIGDHYGEVVDIGIRSTRIVTLDDTLVTIPNDVFFTEAIANANAGNAEMLVAVEFYVAPAADTVAARRIVEEALCTSQYAFVSDDLPVAVLVEDSPRYTTITGKAYVNDLRNEEKFRTDVSERVLDEFTERGIPSPRIPPGLEVAGE